MPRRATSGTEGVSITKLRKSVDDPLVRRFLCRVRIPGTSQYTSRCFLTQKEAKSWGVDKFVALKAGTETANEAFVDVMALEYCRQLSENGEGGAVSPDYIRHLQLVAEGLKRAGIRDMKAPTFAANVRSWIANLKPNWWVTGKACPWFCKTGGKPLTNVTRNKILSEIRRLCNYAVNHRRLAYNPLDCLTLFRSERRLKPTFSLDELRSIVSNKARTNGTAKRDRVASVMATANGDKKAAASQMGVHLSTVYNQLEATPIADDPWWLPACLMVYTGCRVQEAMHLRWQDFDWKSERVRVRLQDCYDQKTDTEREFPLQPELACILKPIAKPSGFIIEDEWMRKGGAIQHRARTKELTKLNYTKGFVRYLKRIGIDAGQAHNKRTVHSLRHAWVAMMLATGESPKLAAVWAGHGGDVQDRYAGAMSAYHREASRWSRGVIQLRTCGAVAMEATG